MYPEEEPLRFRTDIRDLKSISETLFESFLGFLHPHETLKILPLGTGSVIYLFFLECRYKILYVMNSATGEKNRKSMGYDLAVLIRFDFDQTVSR